jgi:CrcB protein
MEMGSPETAREADDSCRLFAAVGVCPETAARRVFVFAEHDMITYLWVAIGSALGGMARHGCTIVVAKWFGTAFPWGTLFINILGSFVIGLVFTLTGVDGRFDASTGAKAFVMVGICGGYTTFSSFSLQTLALAQEGQWLRAGAYIVASVVLCLIGVWAGHALASAVNAAGSGA